MKIELSEADLKQIADMVTDNLSKKLLRGMVDTAHYEAMVETGKQMALRLYGDMETNGGVHQVIDRKVGEICREDLRYVIKTELETLMGSEDKLQKQLFGYLLEGVVEKARALAYRVNYGHDEE